MSSELDEALILDFPSRQSKSTIDSRDLETRWIRNIKIIYDDGEIESFTLPETQGFVRKRYTILQGEQKGEVLICYDIHWALKGKHGG